MADPPAMLTGHRFWLVHAAIWLGIGLITILATLPYPHAFDAPLQRLVLALFGCIASAALRPVYRLLAVLNRSLAAQGAIVLGASVVAGFLLTIGFNSLPVLLFGALGVDVRPVGPWTRVLKGNVFHTSLLVAWSVGYVAALQSFALHAAREQLLRAEVGQRDARLDALRYQLNPHYLFNALNTLTGLIAEGRTDLAAAVTVRLGGYLRSLLAAPGAPEVTVARELALLDQYLAVERARLGDRLLVRITADDDTLDALVPNLVLQPLVENAIRYALSGVGESAVLVIRTRRRGDCLSIVVANNHGGGGPAAATPGSGVGLDNTRARLTALYPGRHGLVLRHGKTATTVAIRVPFRTSTTA